MSEEGSGDPSRSELAAQWAERLNATAYIPMSRDALQCELRALLDLVCEALNGSDRIDEAGREVGRRLVAMHATGEESLRTSLDLLRENVLRGDRDNTMSRALWLVTGTASGYAAADRANTFEQQERLKRALLKSKLQSDREREVKESHLHEVFTNAPVGMAICELDGQLTQINPALATMLNYRPQDLGSLTIRDLFHPDDAAYLSAAYAELARDDGSRRLREHRKLISSDGTAVEAYLAVSVLRDGDGVPRQFITMMESISELHRLQERFHFQALHDSMTGLPNRQFFRTQLEATLASIPAGASLVIYQLGLNGFELVNDGLGYETGDILIRSVARRLERLVAEHEAMVARFGGTEFGILLRETPTTPPVPRFVTEINDVLAEPFYVGEHGIATTASIGVARAVTGDSDSASLMWSAEVALRRAEDAGDRQWALFDPKRAPDERDRAKLAAVIPGALELGEFGLTYRPVSAMDSGRLATLEVQLRWRPEGYSELEHAQCLSLAERSGVTLALRDWVLQAAWQQLEEWYEAGYEPRLALSLTPHQAEDPDLVAAINGVLRDSKVEADKLSLSFPIQAVSGDREEVKENIGYLYDQGVLTGVHDFQGSPEQFRLLRDLPVYAVRLAPDLVRIVHDTSLSEDDPELVAASRVVPLLSTRTNWVVISGVHSREQAERWQRMGYRCAGYGDYYGRPIPAADVPALLDRWPVEDRP